MSRGRRDVRRSLTTLLVLGSMTMRLLVFSLLTKTRPVSLAHPAEDNAAANTTMQSGADNRRRMGTGDPLLLAKTIDPSVRLIQVAGQAVNAPTLPSPHAGREGWGMPAMQFRRELGGYPLMDDRSGGVIAKPALLL